MAAYVKLPGMVRWEAVSVPEEHTFRAASAPRRIAVAVAGVTMNLVLALTLLTAASVGRPVQVGGVAVVRPGASDVPAGAVIHAVRVATSGTFITGAPPSLGASLAISLARGYYKQFRTLDGLSSTLVAWHWLAPTTASEGPNHLSVAASEGEMVAVAANTHQTCRTVLYLEAGTVLSYIGWYVEGPAPEAPPPDTTEIAAPATSALYYGQYPAQLGCSATTGLQAVEVWGTQW